MRHRVALDLDEFDDVEVVEGARRLDQAIRRDVDVGHAREVGLCAVGLALGAELEFAQLGGGAAEHLVDRAADGAQDLGDFGDGHAVRIANGVGRHHVGANLQVVTELDAELAVPLRTVGDRVDRKLDAGAGALGPQLAGGEVAAAGVRRDGVPGHLGDGRRVGAEARIGGTDRALRRDGGGSEEEGNKAGGTDRRGKTGQHGSSLRPAILRTGRI